MFIIFLLFAYSDCNYASTAYYLCVLISNFGKNVGKVQAGHCSIRYKSPYSFFWVKSRYGMHWRCFTYDYSGRYSETLACFFRGTSQFDRWLSHFCQSSSEVCMPLSCTIQYSYFWNKYIFCFLRVYVWNSTIPSPSIFYYFPLWTSNKFLLVRCFE